MNTIFILLVLFQLKHFFADFLLLNEYMLRKFKDGREFILPLMAHCGVHAVFTFGIALMFTSAIGFSIVLSFFDFAVHFTMDRLKAGKRYLGRFKPLTGQEYTNATSLQKKHNKFFWWSIGFDQMVHHLTYYAIIALIIFYPTL